MRVPKLVSLVAFESDNKDTLTFQFKSQDGRSHYVPMKAGLLNAMLPAIMNVRRTVGDSHAPTAVQPVTLTSARAAYHEEVRPCSLLGWMG
jgi:hypothetical protein